MNITDLVDGIVSGNSTSLARGITLLESQRPSDWELSKQLLEKLPKDIKKAFRLGFSGPPGVGKSSFLEKLGIEITSSGERVAVLAIDPSSEITGGSILGDKTRMEELSRQANAFIRPSATRGHLGGVTSSLPGVITLCEAAGFDWVLVESVGVGQSEIELSRMVDHFTFISQPGAGDELQGIKKGILEYVDLILVNKEDRDPKLVSMAKQQFLAALKIVRGKEVSVLSCSALTGQGVKDVHKKYEEYFSQYKFEKRKQINHFWFESLLQSEFKKILIQNPELTQSISKYKTDLDSGKISPLQATELFFKDLGLLGDETKV